MGKTLLYSNLALKPMSLKLSVAQLWIIMSALMVALLFTAFGLSIECAQVFGVVGSGASVLGIALTFYQVLETKRIASAARDASNAAREAAAAAVNEVKASHYFALLVPTAPQVSRWMIGMNFATSYRTKSIESVAHLTWAKRVNHAGRLSHTI